ncbi:MAG: helix-turn-helix domain-containing protein [Melioribacteraceae bacterium]|nr:helix-turn-helix domain-containing protein [Melioribacteraceae bacterium]MCF8354191.1 helix-turn-helix domain-containing protein [Melioribacteraceae bacterium]MCF8392837.1 helix-turn-helix domain-containing protein [Melioribacteraceae bacterium]
MFVVINIIAGITAFLLLYFSIFLLITKRGKKLNKILLSAFLFANAIYILNFILNNFPKVFIDSTPYLFHIGEDFGFLFGPFLYFYTLSLVFKNFSLNKNHLIHFIPFTMAILFHLFTFHFRSIEIQQQILLSTGYYPPLFNKFFYSLMNIQLLIYMYLCLIQLKHYSMVIKNHYSEIEKQNLSWLSMIVFAFFFMWIVDLSSFIILLIDADGWNIITYTTLISLSINFVFANYIIYKGLEHPELYSGIEKMQAVKYQKSTLTENEKNNIAHKIREHLDNHQTYLDPNLTLNDLAEAIEINSKYVSQVINEKLGKNFFDLINSYRVEYAKLLIKKNSDKSTVLEILYESGFNSKSVFNSVFKKFTGKTPTEYKKSTQTYKK